MCQYTLLFGALKKLKFWLFLPPETKNEAQYWAPLIFLKFQDILDQKIMGGTRHPGCPPIPLWPIMPIRDVPIPKIWTDTWTLISTDTNTDTWTLIAIDTDTWNLMSIDTDTNTDTWIYDKKSIFIFFLIYFFFINWIHK